MERATDVFVPGTRRGLFPPGVTLAFQRIRQTWRLLSLVGLGMLAAVIVVSAVPLYARVSMTASLRTALTSSGLIADIDVYGQTYQVSSKDINQLTQSFNRVFQKDLGSYILPVQFSLTSDSFSLLIPDGNGNLVPSGDMINMIGVDAAQAAPHLQLVQGYLPSFVVSGNTIEIAVRTDVASLYHWNVGTVIGVPVRYLNRSPGPQAFGILQLRIAGIFNLPKNDLWHGETFGITPGNELNYVHVLVSNDALISLLDQDSAKPSSVIAGGGGLTWYYGLDTAHIQIDDVDPIQHGIQQVLIDNANITNTVSTEQSSNIQHLLTFLPPAANNFVLYHDRLPIAQFPVTSLTVLVLCLVLFFIAMMTGILVDRQSGSIALLRSRGASSGQVFWSLVIQAMVLGLFALVVGPVLSVLLARLLAQMLLPSADQGALNILAGNPLPIALSVGLFALVTACVMVLAMIVSVWSTASRDVLALRREAARTTQRALWQRLNLDRIVILVALVGAGFALYLTNSSALDARIHLLLFSPLTLLEAGCLLLAALLFLLRGFPLLLRGCSWLAARRRSAPALLALAQMSRAPRQSVRMTLLLALATAFVIFTLVFQASQTQRIQAVADYQAGADFSGLIPASVAASQSWDSVEQAYRQLPGVLSASMGYVKLGNAGGGALNLPIDFRAVDGDTFAQTARWSTQDSTQPLADLTRQLVSARAAAIKKGIVPAIVDANTWNELHLSPGATFTLNIAVVTQSDQVTFQAIAEVQHIPTSGDSSIAGVLADYQTFAGAYEHTSASFGGFFVPPNYVWLRSSDDSAQLAALRNQLSQGDLKLVPLYDRRLMVEALANEPLYLMLFGILLLGATTALLLALVGNLLASWLNARSRLANFAALRALGATPRQIAATLGWEQVIVYSAAMLLGVLFGWLLMVVVLPSLVFTSILPDQITGAVDSATFYAEQNTPPVQIVVPPALWIALGALVLLCVLALGMMVRVVSRPSIAQVLRLNED